MSKNDELIYSINNNPKILTAKFIRDNLLRKDCLMLNGRITSKLNITNDDLYSILLNIDNTCLNCKVNKTKYKTKNKGFGIYCSINCSNSHKDKKMKSVITSQKKFGVDNCSQSKLIKDKKAQTMMKNYGVKTPLEIPYIQIKANLAKHKLIKFADKSLYNLYSSKVWKITKGQDITSLINSNKRGISNYHLDHKFSIRQGFELNIPPYIIGNLNNLEFLYYKDNLSKNSNCSITIEQLFKNT